MDIWGIVWQALAYGALAAIVIVVIFAIIEPGPLQEHRRFGRRRRDHQEEADEDEQADRSPRSPSEEL